MTKNKTLLGAHLSISGGFYQALLRGQEIGCNAIQIFTHSNRQWHIPPLKDTDRELFIKTQSESSIKLVVVHASYLLNIASSDTEIRKKSRDALIKELERCNSLQVPYLILHPGSRLSTPLNEALANSAQALDEALEIAGGKVMVLIENMAGQGSVVGSRFEELATIRSLSHHKKRIGFCFDTCHAYAAGYNFTDADSYKNLWLQFDAILGLEHLKAMHINDCKSKCGSHVDRHEHIGKGNLGLDTFSFIMNDKKFMDIPKIIETPKGDDSLQEDKKNIDTLKELIR